MGILKWSSFAQHGEECVVARHRYRRPVPGNSHTHAYAEVFWYENGSGVHRINGKRHYHSAGDLIFVRADDDHALWSEKGTEFTIVNVSFPTSNITRLEKTYGNTVSRCWPKKGQPVMRHLDAAQLETLGSLAEELAASERTRITLDRFLLNLLHMIDPEGSTNNSDPIPQWLASACREVKEPRHFYLGTREFARLCKRCPEYVARAARRYLGSSPSEIVNSARLDYAATQLVMTDTDIIEISMSCGYDSLSYFYKLFKQRFRMSPRAYRKAQILKETTL